MKRFKHSLSYYKLVTMDGGELIPVACFEVLPGDTVQQATSALIRVSPLLHPVMHPVRVRIHHFFVPYRLLWDDWEKFITGGSDGVGEGAVYPTITAGAGGFVEKGLLDYLGPPPLRVGLNVSALPVRAYNEVFNEYYRDQDLIAKVNVPRTGGADTTSSLVIQKCAWEKDYFTSARPWPQKGPDITLPLGTFAPVRGLGIQGASAAGPVSATETLPSGVQTYASVFKPEVANKVYIQEDPANTGYPKVWADLSTASAVNVNDVRLAFAMQRYQEARAQYGSRYTEYLAFLGIRSSDARLQRPEYLGGGQQTISFSEVLQTGPDAADAGVGDLKGHGISALRSRRYRRFFEEHGVVLSLMSIRPRTMYNDGVDRMWLRRTKEDFYQRELEQVGQQEIMKGEIYASGTAADLESWAYQDRYADYRHQQSRVAGEFRTILNDWHYSRQFASLPTLNGTFVTCQPTKRVYAEQTKNSFWVMVSNSIQARRMVGRKTIGRIL